MIQGQFVHGMRHLKYSIKHGESLENPRGSSRSRRIHPTGASVRTRGTAAAIVAELEDACSVQVKRVPGYLYVWAQGVQFPKVSKFI